MSLRYTTLISSALHSTYTLPQKWINNWKKNGWKTANKQPVKNKELWTELDLMTNEFQIKWSWVKGHSTDILNNEVDLIAREAASS